MAPKRSIIWDHYDDKGNDKAMCKLCKTEISYKSSTSNLTKHINRKHGNVQLMPRQVSTPIAEAVQAAASTVGATTVQAVPSTSNAQQPIIASIYSSRNAMTSYLRRDCTKIKKDIDSHIFNLFIYDLQPFSIVEDRGFRELISFAFPNYILPTRKYFSNNMLPALYETCKTEVKALLSNEMISICLTTDMWTSRNGDWFLAVTGHFIDQNMVLRSNLLECSALNGASSTAVELSHQLLRIAQEWSIERKIILAVSDNGSNIKCAIEKCLGWKHFSCYAHSLNLIVQKALENECISNIIHKAKSIVALFKKSNVAWEKLKRFMEQANKTVKRPLQEVPTRWNSTFYMLKRLLEMKEEVNSTISNLSVNIPALSGNEWLLIEKLVFLLKPCEEVTKEMSGDKYVTGSSVIPITIALKSALAALERLPDPVEMVRQDLLGGLMTRFSSLEHSRTFTTCMFLDPRFKLYFESDQTADLTKKHVIGLVTGLMAEESQDLESTSQPQDTDETSSLWSDYFKKMKNIRPQGTAYSRAVVEVQRYIDDKIIDKNECPLHWWKANSNSYPHLAILARKNLNALATSVPCERLFSVAGNIVSERRTRLGIRKVQQMLFLQQNLKK